jgi:hypothetical protein
MDEAMTKAIKEFKEGDRVTWLQIRDGITSPAYGIVKDNNFEGGCIILCDAPKGEPLPVVWAPPEILAKV